MKNTKDYYLVFITLFFLSLIIWGAQSFFLWPILGKFIWVFSIIFLTCMNYQCVAHNFIHNPFFKSNSLNSLFSIVNSLTIGLPQSLYTVHHMNHHRFNNDHQDPLTSTTKDYSSIFRYSQHPKIAESIWSYTFLGIFRTDFSSLYQPLKNHQDKKRLLFLELFFIFIFAFLLILFSPQFFFMVYLPIWYFGQCFSLFENYLEHYKATPGNRLTDSVSCYNILYNFLWFNNGYHQEHHFAPQVHWSEIKNWREKMLPESQRRVVRWAHFFNW